MNISLQIAHGDAKAEVSLGHQAVTALIDSFFLSENSRERSAWSKVFALLCHHPSSKVRAAIAGQWGLSRELALLFAKDECSDVVRALVSSNAAGTYLQTEDLLRIIDQDVEAAARIAIGIDRFQEADENVLAARLASHTDPGVRWALASSGGTSRRVKRQLACDSDSEVRQRATEGLER